MRSGLAELRLFPDAGHVSLLNSADGALDWITTNRRVWDERFDKLDVLLADLQPDRKRRGRTGG